MSKQSFFAPNATGALRSEAQEVIAAHTVISLDADEESFFGYITSLSTDKRPTFGILPIGCPRSAGSVKARVAVTGNLSSASTSLTDQSA